MSAKSKKTATLIGAFSFTGLLLMFIGMTQGKNIAVKLSRPIGASSWETTLEFMNACTFTIAALGASLIVVALVFTVIVFAHWYKREENSKG